MDLESGFFVADNGKTYSGGAKDDKGQGCGGGGGGNQNKNRWYKITCPNCGKLGHVSHNYFLPSNGSHNSGCGGHNNTTDAIGGSGKYLRCPPRQNEPRNYTLESGREVKWCGKYKKWSSHFRAQHTVDNSVEGNTGGDGENTVGNNATILPSGNNITAVAKNPNTNTDVGSSVDGSNNIGSINEEDGGGSFDRLREASLI